MKTAARTFAVILTLSVWAQAAFGETRGQPYPEEYLVKTCPSIFVGTVLEVNEHAMPTRVKVMLSIKGNIPLNDRNVEAKHPGRFVILEEEFDKAKKGSVGVFFVGQDWSPDVLMKYKEIPGISRKANTHEKPDDSTAPK